MPAARGSDSPVAFGVPYDPDHHRKKNSQRGGAIKIVGDHEGAEERRERRTCGGPPFRSARKLAANAAGRTQSAEMCGPSP